MSRLSNDCRKSIRDTMLRSFNQVELNSLCFELGVNDEDLQGTTLSAKIQSLIGYFDRLNDAEALLAILQHQRPNDMWCSKLVDDSAEMRKEVQEFAEKGKQAADAMNELIRLMAESRLLELEITKTMFGGLLTKEQLDRMQKHISALSLMTQK
jgi:hypothetical protein